MSFRTHPLTGERIIFAPERAARPSAYGGDAVQRCPFCPGHESDTPPQISASGDPWRVRVFPNKYPALPGAEVIVESAEHGATFEDIEHADDVVAMYVERYRAHDDSAATIVFKNEGPRGGASIPHVHSQVVPLDFVPPRIAAEADGFARASSCPLCGSLCRSMYGTVIEQNGSFVWLAPAASKMPYQQWLVPRRHAADMRDLVESERSDLASLLRVASRAMRSVGDSYNWMFMNFPRSPAAHWYVDLFPRLTNIAGFELGTGTFVEIIDPSVAAKRLRES